MILDERKDQLTELGRDGEEERRAEGDRETLLIEEEEDSHEKSVHRRP